MRDVRGEEKEHGVEGGNKEDRKRETQGVEEDVREGVREEPLEPLDVPSPSSFRSMEGILLEMERRMRKHIEEMGQSIQSRIDSKIDHGFAELNAKIDWVVDHLQSLASKGHEEGSMGRSSDPIEGDHSGIGCDASHNPQDDDRLTYVTPETEVHSGVFIDEKVGDTVKEVTSPISGEKKWVRKRGKVLCTP